MYRKIFIDTSAWLAYSLAGERDHVRVKKLMHDVLTTHVMLFTSNDVIDETITRLVYHTNYSITKRFMEFIDRGLTQKRLIQVWTDEQIQSEAFAIVKKFIDKKVSLTDATSIVLMKRYNIDAILTLDSDFTKVGLRVLP